MGKQSGQARQTRGGRRAVSKQICRGLLEVRRFKRGDEDQVIRLWTECGLVVPWNDPRRDIRRKLRVGPEMFLVGCEGGRVIATVMAGYDGHRGWINYLAVAAVRRRSGVGRRMMDEAEALLRAAGCPKINLQVRTTNKQAMEFYRRTGFTADDVESFGKRLEPDARGLRPTPRRGSARRPGTRTPSTRRAPRKRRGTRRP